MYWTRRELKDRAKKTLKKNYILTFFMCLILFLISGSFSGSNSRREVKNHRYSNEYYYENQVVQEDSMYIQKGAESFVYSLNPLIKLITSTYLGVLAFIVFIVTIAFSIFIAYPLSVGIHKFLSNISEGKDVGFECLSFGFFKENYFNTVKGIFFQKLYIFFWSLLFIIPGIIKAYSYRMVPYILADNPTLNYHEVLDLSKKMTSGHKFNMYVLDLSFILWLILGIIIPFGFLFLNPYIKLTEAELYLELKRGMIDSDPSSAEYFNEAEYIMPVQ